MNYVTINQEHKYAGVTQGIYYLCDLSVFILVIKNREIEKTQKVR